MHLRAQNVNFSFQNKILINFSSYRVAICSENCKIARMSRQELLVCQKVSLNLNTTFFRIHKDI